jgi:hypothetical protein
VTWDVEPVAVLGNLARASRTATVGAVTAGRKGCQGSRLSARLLQLILASCLPTIAVFVVASFFGLRDGGASQLLYYVLVSAYACGVALGISVLMPCGPAGKPSGAQPSALGEYNRPP